MSPQRHQTRFYQSSLASDLCKRSRNIRLVPAEKSGARNSVQVEGRAERSHLHSRCKAEVK